MTVLRIGLHTLVLLLACAAASIAQRDVELEAVLTDDPGNIEARSNLIRIYFQNSRRDPAAVKVKARHILWLVSHQPEAPILTEPAATISDGGDDYDSVKKAWLAQIERPDLRPQVLANAANFFRPREPARSIELLAKARSLEPKNWMWTAMLGQKLAFELSGISELNQNGFPIAADPAKAQSQGAQTEKAKLLASNDPELLGAVASALGGQGAIAAAMTGRLDENAALSRQLIARAASIEPRNARWPAMMAQSFAQQAERSAGEQRPRYVRQAMAQFDAARGIDPASVGDLPPSTYQRMAIEGGALDQARASAERCLAQAPSVPVKDAAIHECTITLGRIALRQGDLKRAGEYLLAAGRVQATGALSSFGPNMMLALELLQKGQRDIVLEYLQQCSKFWTYDRGQLAKWSAAIGSGEIPNFGANLIY